MIKECTVNGVTYVAVETNSISCKGCAARGNRQLCTMLDTCCFEPTIIWQEKTEALLDENKQYQIID